MSVLVTGAAGFIGFHLSNRLLERGTEVTGYDNLNPYYDPSLKQARLDLLKEKSRQTGTSFNFVQANLEDKKDINSTFALLILAY